MRIPFLQVHQSAWPRARTLAGLLRVHRREALGLALDLWCWALELSPEEAITGVFLDAAPAEFLAAGLEWSGDAEALLLALVRAGFVELVDGGLRVKGLDLYAEILEDRRKDRERKSAAARARSGGIPAESRGRREESTRQTQTQTQTQTQEKIPPRAGARAEHGEAPVQSTAPRRAEVADVPPPEAPPLDDLGAHLNAIHRRARGRSLEWGPSRQRVAVERALGDLAAAHGDAEVLRRLENALTYPAGKFPYFAVANDLAQHWGRYADPAPGARVERSAETPQRVDLRTLGAVWGPALERLRADKPYAAEQLARLREVSSTAETLTLEAPDPLVAGWVQDSYGPLLERVLAPRRLRLVVAGGGPDPPPAPVAEEMHAERAVGGK